MCSENNVVQTDTKVSTVSIGEAGLKCQLGYKTCFRTMYVTFSGRRTVI